MPNDALLRGIGRDSQLSGQRQRTRNPGSYFIKPKQQALGKTVYDFPLSMLRLSPYQLSPRNDHRGIKNSNESRAGEGKLLVLMAYLTCLEAKSVAAFGLLREWAASLASGSKDVTIWSKERNTQFPSVKIRHRRSIGSKNSYQEKGACF